jgi:regulator of sigma E protease
MSFLSDYLLPFLLALGLLILVHELGHYLAARWCGVKVLRFSIGFGRPLFMRRAGADATEWVLAVFPLGGYVKMLDEREAAVGEAELARAFNRQSVWRRLAIVAAGPLANLLLAIVIFWGMFVVGSQELRPMLAVVGNDTPAALGGVAEGDLVRSIDGEEVPSWKELRWILFRHALERREVELHVRTRAGAEAVRRLDLSGFSLDDAGIDPIAAMGLGLWWPPLPAVVGDIENGAAARAGLQKGDRILAIDDKSIESWEEVVDIVRASAGRERVFRIDREGAELDFVIVPDAVEENGQRIGRLGVRHKASERSLEMFGEVRYGVGAAFVRAVRQTWEMCALSLRAIGQMISGEVSLKNVSGPITIADFAGQSAKLGFGNYINFLALISISLGVLNLLPVPVLDGGHLLYYAAEIVKGGPLPERVLEVGQQIGLTLLLMLMALAIYNDINRLISG